MASIVRARPNAVAAVACAALVAAMVTLTYASVPLYRLFCQVTGYGGTTQRASAAPNRMLAREVTVEFDANTGGSLPWTFTPVQRRLRVRVGEEVVAHYRVRNNSGAAVTGSAVFNVTPDKAGKYFAKIQCFCFLEQTLQAGATADLPVVFFVDPAVADDLDLKELKTITLSYTFYPAASDGVGIPAAPTVESSEPAAGNG